MFCCLYLLCLSKSSFSFKNECLHLFDFILLDTVNASSQKDNSAVEFLSQMLLVVQWMLIDPNKNGAESQQLWSEENQRCWPVTEPDAVRGAAAPTSSRRGVRGEGSSAGSHGLWDAFCCSFFQGRSLSVGEQLAILKQLSGTLWERYHCITQNCWGLAMLPLQSGFAGAMFLFPPAREEQGRLLMWEESWWRR